LSHAIKKTRIRDLAILRSSCHGWWGATEKKVETFVLDMDVMRAKAHWKEDAGCAEAIKHSMKTLNDTIALILKGRTTDSGGGGAVLESLTKAKELKKRDLCTPTYSLLVASCSCCTLHAIQIALANPVKYHWVQVHWVHEQ
jgi:hypothetical protein